jgi:hypothetical protein
MRSLSVRHLFIGSAVIAFAFASTVPTSATAQTQYPIKQSEPVVSVTPGAPTSAPLPQPPTSAVKVAGASVSNPDVAPSVAPAQVLGNNVKAANVALTGSNATTPLIIAAVAALASGLLLVGISRRRRPDQSACTE